MSTSGVPKPPSSRAPHPQRPTGRCGATGCTQTSNHAALRQVTEATALPHPLPILRPPGLKPRTPQYPRLRQETEALPSLHLPNPYTPTHLALMDSQVLLSQHLAVWWETFGWAWWVSGVWAALRGPRSDPWTITTEGSVDNPAEQLFDIASYSGGRERDSPPVLALPNICSGQMNAFCPGRRPGYP